LEQGLASRTLLKETDEQVLEARLRLERLAQAEALTLLCTCAFVSTVRALVLCMPCPRRATWLRKAARAAGW